MKKLLLILTFLVVFSSFASAALSDDTLSYFKLDETSGTIAYDSTGSYNGTNSGATVGATGKINTAYDFDGSNDYIEIDDETAMRMSDGDYSFSFWFKSDSIATEQRIIWKSYTTSGAVDYDIYLIGSKMRFRTAGNYFESDNTLSSSTWYHIVLTRNQSNGEKLMYINGNVQTNTGTDTGTTTTGNDNKKMQIGRYYFSSFAESYFDGKLDEVGIWSKVLNSTEVSELYNAQKDGYEISVELLNPENNSIITTSGKNFTAQFNITSSYNYTWENTTFQIWKNGEEFNSTLVTLSGNNTNTTLFIDDFTLGDYEWNVYACYINATFSNCTYSENGNFTFEVGADITNSTYETNVYETASAYFYAEMDLIESADLFAVKLIYNGNEYSATKMQVDSDTYMMSKTIDIPLVNTSQNVSFYWRYIYALDGDYGYQNSTTFNQTINPIHFVSCNATYSEKSIIFIVRNETNPNPEINASFYSSWEYWLGSGSVKKTYSWEDVNDNNSIFQFCVDTGENNLSINAQIDYTNADSILRTYYIQNGSINNDTTNITLYLLPTYESTSILVYVKDYLLNPLSQRIVKAQRYDTGEGVWKTVELTKTDEFGKGLMHLLQEDADYKFIIEYGGTSVYISEPQRIVCTGSPCSIEFKIGATNEELILFNNIDGITHDLYFNNDTKNVVFVWDDTTGLTSYFRLLVQRQTYNGRTTICDSNSTDTSGSLVCSLDNRSGTYFATVYRSASPEYPFSQIVQELNNGFSVFGEETYAWGIFLILLMFFVGLASGVVTALVGLLAGIIILATMGVTALGWASIIFSVIIIVYFITQLKN